MVAHAETGELRHVEVVGAVADTDRLAGRHVEARATFEKSAALPFAVEDGLIVDARDLPGEEAFGRDFDRVGTGARKAETFGDRSGEFDEAAREKPHVKTVGLHEVKEVFGTRRKLHGGERLFEDRSGRILEEFHALTQAVLEAEFPGHRLLRDRAHLIAAAHEVAEDVEAFGFDERAVEVDAEETVFVDRKTVGNDVDVPFFFFILIFFLLKLFFF